MRGTENSVPRSFGKESAMTKQRKLIFTIAFLLLAAILAFSLFVLILPGKDAPAEEEDGFYLYDGYLCKPETQLKENQIQAAVNKLNSLKENHFADSSAYYAVIPDKAYYSAAAAGAKTLDYDLMLGMLDEGLVDYRYIDLFDTLQLEDFYRSDAHWRQEAIFPVVQKLTEAMGSSGHLTPEGDYTATELSPFFGNYTTQTSKTTEADTLIYLSSPLTESAVVSGADPNQEILFYDTARFEAGTGYDLFLSGAQPVLTVHCENAESDRELIIFRDSYASSLAPLLLGAYKTVTLVDLRYMSSALLDQFVDFHGQDILFLYSISLLNNAMLLK